MENLNMRTVPLQYALKYIKKALDKNDFNPVVLMGKSGIGKTEAITGLATEMGIKCVEVRLSLYSESDLVGMPYIESVDNFGNVTRHAVSTVLPPMDSTEKGILMLDEVTSSSKSMRTAVYQLMDVSRKLGEYRLPKNWKIIACGNGEFDGGDFRGMEAAFLNRAMAWRVEPEFKAWKQWAIKKGINSSVVAYLSFEPSKLHVMDESGEAGVFPSPRSWVKLAENLDMMENDNGKKSLMTDYEDLEYLAAGVIGAEIAPRFVAFYKFNTQTISPDDIVAGKIKDPNCLRGSSRETLYLTAENITSIMIKDFKEAKEAGKKSSAWSKAVQETVNVMSWITMLDKGINPPSMDVFVAIIQDMNNTMSNMGLEFTDIIMDEKFDEQCPDLADFIAKHNVALGNLQ